MENNIVLVHAAFVVLFLLYLLIRLLVSIFGLTDKAYQTTMRAKFRVPDWLFIGGILVTGLYPILVLGRIELYHLIKIALLGIILWSSRFANRLNFAGVTLGAVLLLGYSSYISFMDKPLFPRGKGTFEKSHPEMSSLPQIEKGRLIFETVCIECHGSDGRMGRFQAADLTTSILDFEQKNEVIRSGSPLTVMRSFASELSEDEISAVTMYVHQFTK